MQCLGFIAKSKLRKKFISYVRRCLPFLACPWKRGGKKDFEYGDARGREGIIVCFLIFVCSEV